MLTSPTQLSHIVGCIGLTQDDSPIAPLKLIGLSALVYMQAQRPLNENPSEVISLPSVVPLLTYSLTPFPEQSTILLLGSA